MSNQQPLEPPIIESIGESDAMDIKLQEAFVDDAIKQVDRLDDLAKELLKIQLALPTIFLLAFRLIHHDQALEVNVFLLIAIALWIMALFLNLHIITPKAYTIKQSISRAENDPNCRLEPFENIESYFYCVAQRKYKKIAQVIRIFLLGVFFAILPLFEPLIMPILMNICNRFI